MADQTPTPDAPPVAPLQAPPQVDQLAALQQAGFFARGDFYALVALGLWALFALCYAVCFGLWASFGGVASKFMWLVWVAVLSTPIAILQVWLIVLAFRIGYFILTVRADVNMITYDAARIATSAISRPVG